MKSRWDAINTVTIIHELGARTLGVTRRSMSGVLGLSADASMDYGPLSVISNNLYIETHRAFLNIPRYSNDAMKDKQNE